MQYACDQIGVKYLDYITDHRVLVEAQMATAEKFHLDYVSVISDPAREAADCGAKVEFFEDQPPAFVEDDAFLADKTKLVHLKPPDPQNSKRMLDRIQGVALFREKVQGEKMIEGWVEGPCAEGADLRGINTLMLDFFDDPDFVHDLFSFIVEMELKFAKAQIEAGAELIGIGDAAASLVGPQIYETFVWPYEKKMVDGICEMGAMVRLHICGNTRFALGNLGRLGCHIVDLDFPSPMHEAREAMGDEQILLGNLNPVSVLLEGDVRSVLQGVGQCHQEAGDRFIIGAGCEIPRNTPEENVKAMLEYAQGSRP